MPQNFKQKKIHSSKIKNKICLQKQIGVKKNAGEQKIIQVQSKKKLFTNRKIDKKINNLHNENAITKQTFFNDNIRKKNTKEKQTKNKEQNNQLEQKIIFNTINQKFDQKKPFVEKQKQQKNNIKITQTCKNKNYQKLYIKKKQDNQLNNQFSKNKKQILRKPKQDNIYSIKSKDTINKNNKKAIFKQEKHQKIKKLNINYQMRRQGSLSRKKQQQLQRENKQKNNYNTTKYKKQQMRQKSTQQKRNVHRQFQPFRRIQKRLNNNREINHQSIYQKQEQPLRSKVAYPLKNNYRLKEQHVYNRRQFIQDENQSYEVNRNKQEYHRIKRNMFENFSSVIQNQMQTMNQLFLGNSNIFVINNVFQNLVRRNNDNQDWQWNQSQQYQTSEEYTLSSEYDNYEEEQQGMGDQEIDAIETTKFHKSIDGNHQCTICLASLKQNESIKKLQCEHIFHPECIDEWLRRKAACPVCRYSLVN